MTQSLGGKSILVLAANGVDESGMSVIQRDLLKAGAKVKTVGAEAGVISSWNGNAWGVNFITDANVSTTLGSDFDVLVVPAGERSINTLSTNPHSARIISSFTVSEKAMYFMGDASKLLEAIGNDDATSCAIMLDDAESLISTMSGEEVELKQAA